VLLGVTGSGKTFTVSHVVALVNKPTLVIAPNKTLAAQLYHEFRTLFPDNAVRYFVSYYDYYQPEAYVPSTDTYIEKDASINDEIDKMRHAATKALLERNDVIVVASVSCIYGLGSPSSYFDMLVSSSVAARSSATRCCGSSSTCSTSATTTTSIAARSACGATSSRSSPRTRRARRSASSSSATRRGALRDRPAPRAGCCAKLERVAIYPASHYVAGDDVMKRAVESIRAELAERLAEPPPRAQAPRGAAARAADALRPRAARRDGLLPRHRELLAPSRRPRPGEPPYTLLDYFPEDYLLVIDESHVTVPQIGGMYRGDRSRKETLVEFGFRLPSALDNRPLNFDEFRGGSRRRSTSPPRRASGRSARPGRGRRAADPPDGLTDPEIVVRQRATRSTICSTRSGSASRPASACS
jgi:excinuclease ABC subunit B